MSFRPEPERQRRRSGEPALSSLKGTCFLWQHRQALSQALPERSQVSHQRVACLGRQMHKRRSGCGSESIVGLQAVDIACRSQM
jgi:hypothetical protein